jgi:hypothetical protein
MNWQKNAIGVDVMVTLITLSGSGATGKTSVADRFAEVQAAIGKKVFIQRSIVRGFYEMEGVANEAAFLAKSPSDRCRFQIKLMYYYYHTLLQRVESCTRDIDFIICERALVDHFAYTLYGGRETVSTEILNEMREQLVRYYRLMPNIFYLPYPAPWNNSPTTVDGFRAREPAKDTIVDAVIFKELMNAPSTAWIGTLEFATIEERAQKIAICTRNLQRTPVESLV